MKFVLVVIALFGAAVTFGAVLPEDDDSAAVVEFVLPEGIKTCDQDDPKLNRCLRETIQEQLPLLHKGSKLLNIPGLDPLEIPNNRFEYSTGLVTGILVLRDVKVYGMSRTIVKDVRTQIDDDGLTSEMDLFFPRIYIEGNYKADVKINEIRMRPKGYFNITMSNISSTTKAAGLFETNKNVKYLRMTAFDVNPEVADMKIYASGLLPDPILNNIVLDFVNQYWPEMYKMMLPETKMHWEPILLEMVNKFLLTVPFEKLITKNN